MERSINLISIGWLIVLQLCELQLCIRSTVTFYPFIFTGKEINYFDRNIYVHHVVYNSTDYPRKLFILLL